MASVNKVILLGNLGRDPETRYTTGGDAVTNLRIATTEQWKDKSGEKQEKTEWHSVVLFGRQAEVAGEYLKKGRSVYIEGRLQTRKWTDKEGVEKYSTEIVADRMQLIGGAREGGGGGGGDVEFSGGGSGAVAAARRPAAVRPPAARAARPSRRPRRPTTSTTTFRSRTCGRPVRPSRCRAVRRGQAADESGCRIAAVSRSTMTPPPRHTSPS